VDLDDRTPALLDAPTAADAINTHGLAAFRDAERAALETVLAELTESTVVVALGGGTPTAPGAADLLRSAQSRNTIRVVYLHAPPSVLRDRLSTTDTDTRPSLTGVNMLDEIETIYLQRDGLYRDLADAVVETADKSKPDLVEKIMASLAHM
jgi:shikimate kinase